MVNPIVDHLAIYTYNVHLYRYLKKYTIYVKRSTHYQAKKIKL